MASRALPTGRLDTDRLEGRALASLQHLMYAGLADFLATGAQMGMLGQGGTTMGGGAGQEGEGYIQETGEEPSRTKRTNVDDKQCS